MEKTRGNPRKKQKYSPLQFQQGLDPYCQFFLSKSNTNTQTFSLSDQTQIRIQNLQSPLIIPRIHQKLCDLQANQYLKILGNYPDFLFIGQYHQFIQNSCLHILNHIYKSQQELKIHDTLDQPPKDQGFTRTKILVLQPSKAHAKNFIQHLLKFHCKGKNKKINKKSKQKFNEYFQQQKQSTDAFQLGIMIQNNQTLKLFTPFCKSDIILASPLSLKQSIQKQASSLSSIQILIIDQASTLIMQNWQHLQYIIQNCNKNPSRDFITANIYRIRDSFFQQTSKFHRQLILTTQFNTPTIMSFFNRNPNSKGKAKKIQHYSGIYPKGPVQQFRKILCSSVTESSNSRLTYFTQTFWPSIKDDCQQTLIFVSSFFEFIRVKNYLESSDPDIMCISQYTSRSSRQRSVDFFKQKKRQVLCLTQRLLFYRKIPIPNFDTLLFFSLPQHPKFYQQLVSKSNSVFSLYTKFDAFSLQRIVGDQKTQVLLKEATDFFNLS